MLQTFRKGAKSWVAKGLMMTLAAAFGLWGINDIFRGSAADTSVATVGGKKIPAADYDRMLRAELRNQSQRLKTDMTVEQARALGLTQAVLDRLIERTALDNETETLGLTASNDTVAAQIRAMPQFQGKGGSFSRQLLDEALQQNNIGEGMFEDGMRSDITREQLIDATTDWLATPSGFGDLLYAYLNQTRTAEYIVLAPADAGNVPPPTDADLGAYRVANAARYSSPEYRELEYVEIGTEQFMDKAQVSDADMKKEYDAHIDQYVKTEQRALEQISFPSKEAADAAHQKLTSGTDFAALAKSMGLKDEDVKLGTFTKSGIDPKLADAAFSIPEGGMTAPVQGPFGWVIIHVTKVTAGYNKTFDEMKDQLRQRGAKDRAAEKVIETANAFEDTRAGGASLEEAAKKLGLTPAHVAAVDRNGLAPDGSKANVPAPAAFLQQAFAGEMGEEGELFQSDDQHSFAIRVIGVRPPALKPLDQVREQVTKDWMDAARVRALAGRAKTLAAEAQKEGSLASAAKTLGRQPQTSGALRRDAVNDVFSPQLLAEMFAQPPGTVISGPVAKGGGYLLARIAHVESPNPNADRGNYEDISKQIAHQVADDLVQSLAASARVTQGTTINEAALNRQLGGTQ